MEEAVPGILSDGNIFLAVGQIYGNSRFDCHYNWGSELYIGGIHTYDLLEPIFFAVACVCNGQPSISCYLLDLSTSPKL